MIRTLPGPSGSRPGETRSSSGSADIEAETARYGVS
jgi:hypothetical protein